MKKAILFGASGFVGSYLLKDLLNHPDYQQVTIVVRKHPGFCHPKLKVLIGDYQTLPGLKDAIEGDEVFIALGTTRKKTPNRVEYYQADHDYPVLAAKIAGERGAGSVFVVTAIGSDANSGIFYVRTKGKTEQDILALNFAHTHLFRPSLIMGKRKEFRLWERTVLILWPLFHPVLTGKWSRYRGMQAKDIARAIISAAETQTEKVKYYHWQDMKSLL